MKNRTYLDCLVLIGSVLSLKEPEIERPILQDVFTTFVTLSLTVEEILFDDKKLEMNIGILLNQYWLDPRLNANIQTRKLAISEKIWKPKITNIFGHQINENTDDDTLYWRGYGEGNITMSKKFLLKAACTKNFRDFPFDTQFCQIKFGSYRFPMDEVSLIWERTNPIIFLNTFNSLQFYLINVSTHTVIDIRATGNFHSALVTFTMKRDPTAYIICVAIPCIIMILISYMSMLVDNHKVQLSSFSICAHVFFYYYSTCLTFPVPYFKCLDIFVGLSAIFSLCSCTESLIFKNSSECKKINECKPDKQFMSKIWIKATKTVGYPVLYVTVLVIYYILCRK